MKPLRLGLIGCGRMGQNHLKALADMPTLATVTTVVEPNHQRWEEIASQTQTHLVASIEDIPSSTCLDGVIIAAPTLLHGHLAAYFLELRIPCLVEKPVVTTVQELDRLKPLMEKASLMVGHSERFNPAFRALMAHIQGEKPKHLVFERRQVPERQGDIDLISDMMIHDLDLILALMEETPLSVEVFSATQDECHARLHFSRGCQAEVIASRCSPERQRLCHIETNNGSHFVADLLNGTLTRNGTRLEVEGERPLQAQCRHFVEVIQDKVPVQVNLVSAEHAMELVWQIQGMAQRHYAGS